MTDREKELQEVLQRIAEWTRAYPPTVFPEVTAADYKKAHKYLKLAGLSVDRISADALRHGLQGIRRIAEGALNVST